MHSHESQRWTYFVCWCFFMFRLQIFPHFFEWIPGRWRNEISSSRLCNNSQEATPTYSNILQINYRLMFDLSAIYLTYSFALKIYDKMHDGTKHFGMCSLLLCTLFYSICLQITNCMLFASLIRTIFPVFFLYLSISFAPSLFPILTVVF